MLGNEHIQVNFYFVPTEATQEMGLSEKIDDFPFTATNYFVQFTLFFFFLFYVHLLSRSFAAGDEQLLLCAKLQCETETN